MHARTHVLTHNVRSSARTYIRARVLYTPYVYINMYRYTHTYTQAARIRSRSRRRCLRSRNRLAPNHRSLRTPFSSSSPCHSISLPDSPSLLALKNVCIQIYRGISMGGMPIRESTRKFFHYLWILIFRTATSRLAARPPGPPE